ncbi:MAG: aminoacyl-tRNA hydrolase [Pyrinomonadaceae bacterium]
MINFSDSLFNCVLLIIGLGNPGDEYVLTRHNMGFMVIDFLAHQTGIRVKRKNCRALEGQGEIEGQAVLLVKPQTYMNLSGETAACLAVKNEGAKILVISDDLALPCGTIRLRERGSSGGHNGLKSIIAALNTDEFMRLRIGIAPEAPVSDTVSFVLDRFPSTMQKELNEIIERSAEAVRALIRHGIAHAMSIYN